MPAETDELSSSSRNENGKRAQGQLLEVERERRGGCPEQQAVAPAPRDWREREPPRRRRAEKEESVPRRRSGQSLRRSPDATRWRISKGRMMSASILVRNWIALDFFGASIDHVVAAACVFRALPGPSVGLDGKL